jgi:hypothetical protein
MEKFEANGPLALQHYTLQGFNLIDFLCIAYCLRGVGITGVTPKNHMHSDG